MSQKLKAADAEDAADRSDFGLSMLAEASLEQLRMFYLVCRTDDAVCRMLEHIAQQTAFELAGTAS